LLLPNKRNFGYAKIKKSTDLRKVQKCSLRISRQSNQDYGYLTQKFPTQDKIPSSDRHLLWEPVYYAFENFGNRATTIKRKKKKELTHKLQPQACGK